jgi:hypothetical protein
MVLAFTGMRWEAVAVLVEDLDLYGQWITVARTASESGGRRDVRDDTKTSAARRTIAVPDIAMPAVRRLVARGAKGRLRSDGLLHGQPIKGDRGGYLGYAMWRKYLRLAHGHTAAQKGGMVGYTVSHGCGTSLRRS